MCPKKVSDSAADQQVTGVQIAAGYKRASEMAAFISKHGVPNSGGVYSAAATCGATSQQLQFLHACCASVQSSTATSLSDKLGPQAASAFAQRAAWAVFYACASHPDELLCSREQTYANVRDIVASLLPTTRPLNSQGPQANNKTS